MIRVDHMSGRIVLVTGATGGLGGAIVDAFKQTGDTVVPVSRSSREWPADLTVPEQAGELVARVIASHGRIDVLVHAMGGFAGGETLAATPLDTWERMLTINLKAAVYVCRAVLPHMLQAGGGRIVAVGSRAGVQPSAGLSAYAVSKAALHALMQTIALEVKGQGITANAVLPSTIDTPANRAWGTPAQAASWVQPESIAGSILWLASEAAADVSGALVPVYGDA
jgi:NAD(P)-dependent dehydrogenase (short-subunit alcohol dehydrogenase family)